MPSGKRKIDGDFPRLFISDIRQAPHRQGLSGRQASVCCNTLSASLPPQHPLCPEGFWAAPTDAVRSDTLETLNNGGGKKEEKVFFRHCFLPKIQNIAMQLLRRIVNFYLEGFRKMTWGRQLWAIILIKLFVLFVILRLFFFQPVAPTIAQ